MKKQVESWLIIGISVLLAGCSSIEMIKSNMDAKSYPMSYAMDSVPPVTNKKNVSVAIETVKFDPSKLNDKTLVLKDWALLFPLGVVNVWEKHDKCIQGKSMFKDDLASFLQSSLAREINYSGLVKADTDKPSDYSLELSIDKVNTEGDYKCSGISLLVFTTRSEIAGPAVSTLTVSYALKKGGQVVKKNTFSSSKTIEWIKRKYYNNSLLQQDYAASMVRAVASNFKKTNGLIVADLNDYFSKQQ